jgi:hypothetical protein
VLGVHVHLESRVDAAGLVVVAADGVEGTRVALKRREDVTEQVAGVPVDRNDRVRMNP